MQIWLSFLSKEFANSPSDKEESMEIHTSKFCKNHGEEELKRDFKNTNFQFIAAH